VFFRQLGSYIFLGICVGVFYMVILPFFREGRGGGFKEFDEAEIEETKRRRREQEVFIPPLLLSCF